MFQCDSPLTGTETDADLTWNEVGGGDWADISIFHMQSGGVGAYRIVAWSSVAQGRTVLLNSNLNGFIEWEVAEEDFCNFMDEGGNAYGFFFTDADQASQMTRHVEHIKTVTSSTSGKIEPPRKVSVSVGPGGVSRKLSTEYVVLRNTRGTSLPRKTSSKTGSGTVSKDIDIVEEDEEEAPPPPKPASPKAVPPPQAAPATATTNKSKGPAPPLPPPLATSEAVAPAKAAGGPPQAPPKKKAVPTPPVAAEVAASPRRMTATNVSDARSLYKATPPPVPPAPAAHKAGGTGSEKLFSHINHVEYDYHNARYLGVPDEWKDAFNKQFGQPIESLPKLKVEPYDHPIPALLLMLERELFEKHGEKEVGIFRLAPDKDECAFVKQSINKGTYDGSADVNVIANLIKVFLRELPINVLNVVTEETLLEGAEEDPGTVGVRVMEFPEPSRSVFLWVIDLCAKIIKHEDTNKMGVRNMAIVISPNLFFMTDMNPMHALEVSQKVAQFVCQVIRWRMISRFGLTPK